MQLNWWGVPGVLATIAAFGGAIVALRTAPHRQLNQRLATILILDGLFGVGSGPLFFTESRSLVGGLSLLAVAAQAALPFQYLAFLGAALATPLVRPFRSRRAWLLLSIASALLVTMTISMHDRFISEPYHPGWAPWNYRLVGLGEQLSQLNGAVGVFALVAAISALMRTAAGSAARTRAKWFVIAFGVRDLFAVSIGVLYPVLRPIPFWGDFLYNPMISAALFVYVLLLSYGVLQAQLFDMPLKVKFALKQSTVAGGIAAAFFIGSEVIESFVPVNDALLALVAAGVIVLLLRPVERAAERIATTLMPGVEDTSEYLDARKLQVYRAALEGAYIDGVITDEEQAILERLRQELGIDTEEALVAERDVTTAMAGTSH